MKNELKEDEKKLLNKLRKEWINAEGTIQLKKEEVQETLNYIYKKCGLPNPLIAVADGVDHAKKIYHTMSQESYVATKHCDDYLVEQVSKQPEIINLDDIHLYMVRWSFICVLEFWNQIGYKQKDISKAEIEALVPCKQALGFVLFNEAVIIVKHFKYFKFLDDEFQFLHCEDGPAVESEDGYKLYSLNNIEVPEFLVMTPKDKLDPNFLADPKYGADQKIEFLRKFGVENLKNKGTILDSYKNKQYKNNTIYQESRYEVVDMAPVLRDIGADRGRDNRPRPYLIMDHFTLKAPIAEPVGSDCKTILEALSDRNQVDMSKYETKFAS